MKSRSQNKKNMRGFHWNLALVIFWLKIQLNYIYSLPSNNFTFIFKFKNSLIFSIILAQLCELNFVHEWNKYVDLQAFACIVRGVLVNNRNFWVFRVCSMVILRNEKNAVFDDFLIKNLLLATRFWRKLVLKSPKRSKFSIFQDLKFISNSSSSKFQFLKFVTSHVLMRILAAKLKFWQFSWNQKWFQYFYW